MKFGIFLFFENLSEKYKLIKIWQKKGTLHEDQYTFLIISRTVLLRMRNISDKVCRENLNMHFMFNNFFYRKSCRL